MISEKASGSKMPKIKKKCGYDENQYASKKNTLNNYFKPVEKFDMKRILKERQAESEFWKRSDELGKEITAVNILFENEMKKFKEKKCPPPKLGFVVFDHSKYGSLFEFKNNDIITCHLQRFNKMSVEKNECAIYKHFNDLLKSNWVPTLDDIKNVLFNWGADMNTISNKSQIKIQVNDDLKIGRVNFELVMLLIAKRIQNNPDAFSNNDLLTLAKFAVVVNFDYHCGKMTQVIRKLFKNCIETAFCNGDETSIISFGQELYSNYLEEDVSMLVIHLFLPIDSMKGNSIKILYSYLAYKLYKTLLGKTNNINPFPSTINDWFVQDLVNKDFFKYKPNEMLNLLIQLLEHVVIVFDLYSNEIKLSDMYDFLSSIARSTGFSQSLKLINKLDQWRLRLFRLHINRQNIFGY